MLDFLLISTKSPKRDVVEIYPKFIIKKSSDLMIRGGDFYAIWVKEKGLWSTDEQDALSLIDAELDAYYEAHKNEFDCKVKVLHMWDSDTNMIDKWHKYCQKQMRDEYHMLDEKLIFSNMETKKRDYASKKLDYPLECCNISAYEKLISTLYEPEERHKIEWSIGSIISGDSKKIQKFVVLYGAAGTGKSTILNIIQQLFEGYYTTFSAKALGSSNNAFALEAFKTNPLVAIEHDGDLSRIEDNTRLNSLVSHELMTVNEKFKSAYSNRFKCFLFMGTNKPVKITDGRSGLIRRLIDVSPSGEKLSAKEYKQTVKQVGFELGGIAQHCLEVYTADPGYYDDYIPIAMLGASNDFYNYIIDSYHVFKHDDGTSLTAAWAMYKEYCVEANVAYPFSQRVFKEELKNYFKEYKDRFSLDDGSRVRSYYKGFRTDKFEAERLGGNPENVETLKLNCKNSIFDKECANCPAQYATSKETPSKKWDNCETVLADIDTHEVHFVKVPENHIVIDFDLKNENGEKDIAKNIEEASKWPPTYAEVSKSGSGIHLHYIYAGDVEKLSRVFDDHIEIKVFTGKSSLRRKLTKCNNNPIAILNSGLPLKKGGDKVVNTNTIKSEKGLRTLIKKNLNKEIHPATKPSMDFIKKILDDAYNSGLSYDVSDMKNEILAFAAQSTNHADYCIKLIRGMKFCSENRAEGVPAERKEIAFYDIEVFPNLFLVNWKIAGPDKPMHRMVNPSINDVELLLEYNLIGFNCRRYDNHLIYARYMGYTNEEIYKLSQRIINKQKTAFFGEAYNLSYTDVYDFAATKQSLKKWEIELGIHHQELGLSWDKPVPEELWETVAEYCDNDVYATEAVFNHLKGDWTARQILADVANMTVNDTTNSLTTKIIFGSDKNPQNQFNYRNMGELHENDIIGSNNTDEFTRFNSFGRPVFPGYKFDSGKSMYRNEEVGEGGYVYSNPGMWGNVALLDIASMHPSSIIAEELFGKKYTRRFQEIRDARIAIKHGDFEKAKTLLDGKLAKYLDDPSTAKDLAQALKIAINSVYGLTAASFSNAFRDDRNIDNIVAKRGALFMINLKHEVQKRGFVVAHIKTDSIKIPDATPEIIQFVMDYGEMYGYTFEWEATYDKMCLVNDAVYIAKYKDGDWTATGTEFQVPYVFKTLFSKEDISFEDLCETKSVTTALYLDYNEELPEGEHDYKFVGKIGSFCPIKPSCGGGELLRQNTDKDGNNKYSYATGTKGYRWLESEFVKKTKAEKDIDHNYYNIKVDEAIDEISQYGDFEWFASDSPYDGSLLEAEKLKS
jgi:energy-coupling factor transporter ATP-binding protein EcfA2